MSDLKQVNIDKPIVGSIDSILAEFSRNMKFGLDRDKFDFLKLISKTKYSGYTLKNLMSSIKFLQNKDNEWFNELVEDGLAETFSFKGPNGKYDSQWVGWFVTAKGRQLVKEITNNL